MTIAIIVVVLLLLLFIIMRNGIIRKNNQVDNTFAGIDAYLKKRFDLIPNLVSSVQQYMSHEKNLLTEITELRAAAGKSNISSEEKVELNNRMTKALHSFNVAVENYPDLKASANFLQLQQALNEIEEQLSAARRAYNAMVTDYNNAIQTFPSSIIASISGFKTRLLFVASETERQNINVGDLFKK
ncbi:MAG: LemA family protein [Ignavibacteria bacterium]|nr:LemA family protein [Ignavibacteria bacterium]